MAIKFLKLPENYFLKMNPKEAEKLQNEIYQKMPAAKKIEIAGQMFLLGKKLDELKKQKENGPGRTFIKNSRNIRKA